MEFKLKEGFLCGVSSSSDQIEGGDVNSNWNDWSNKGKINDGSNVNRANMHWERWKEDADLLSDMGIQIYRMGLEWARIEPMEGVYDQKVIDRYREEIKYVKEKGVKLLITLHHFSNPMWFEEKGAFLKSENSHFFIEFCEKCIDSFGDLVSDYITINEPNVYALNGYFGGGWPPGRKNMKEYFTVLSNMAYCHIVLYKKIHNIRESMGYKNTMVSFANHVRVFEPKNPKNPWHKLCAAFVRDSFQREITLAMMTGEFVGMMKNIGNMPKGEYADFIGINYYSRSAVAGLCDGTREESFVNDLGWEIYPQGITEVAEELFKILKRPIWVTENGTCDKDDKFRSRYIAEHLQVISNSNLPFERYYHWCFTDNFEWMEGESARFGLVYCDFDTQKRSIKASGHFYQELIQNHGVTGDMNKKYIDKEEYILR